MLTLVERLSAVLLALALAAGQSGVCAGWTATPEARMACCSDDGHCPMHPAQSRDGSTRPLTQAEADSCCAVSGHGDPAPSPAGVALVVTLGPALDPAPAQQFRPQRHADISRAAPVPAARVAKHLLLSVFLV